LASGSVMQWTSYPAAECFISRELSSIFSWFSWELDDLFDSIITFRESSTLFFSWVWGNSPRFSTTTSSILLRLHYDRNKN